jgi:short-subunit dehydrogenase
MHTLITGASSGIGLEFAKICAQNKQNLILVARSKSQLETLAEDLRKTYAVDIVVIPMDLANPASPKQLFDEVNAREVAVNVLINNAGFGDHGVFAQSEWLKQQEMIQLNITSLTELTHLFLPRMIANQNGKILNVASTAAFQPGPLMAVYYATKAFVLSFSEALGDELKGTGVTVTALCPGPTTSGFQKAANMGNIPLFKVLSPPTSRDVAEYGFAALNKGKAVAIHGAINKIVVQSLRVTPRKLVLKIVRSLQEKRS